MATFFYSLAVIFIFHRIYLIYGSLAASEKVENDFKEKVNTAFEENLRGNPWSIFALFKRNRVVTVITTVSLIWQFIGLFTSMWFLFLGMIVSCMALVLFRLSLSAKQGQWLFRITKTAEIIFMVQVLYVYFLK